MPTVSVTALPKRDDLTRSVGIVSLMRYVWFTFLYMGFLTASLFSWSQ